jgi:mono/diheme cytochrome c family protein
LGNPWHVLFHLRAGVLLLGGMMAFAHTGAAQATVLTATRTTLTGVFTDSQAVRGRTVYLAACQSCHTPSEYTGARFKTLWEGHSLLEVFAYLAEQMPKNEPGSLPPEDVVDVIAYLLRINAMPAGKLELPTDSTQLKSIRVVARPPGTRQ